MLAVLASHWPGCVFQNRHNVMSLMFMQIVGTAPEFQIQSASACKLLCSTSTPCDCGCNVVGLCYFKNPDYWVHPQLFMRKYS